MFEKLKTQYKAMDPKRKHMLTIIVAVVIFFGLLAVFTPEPTHRERTASAKTDQVRNVFTDRSSRGDSIDALSGQVSKLSADNDRMRQEINRLKNQNQRESRAREKELEEKLAAIQAEMTHMKETMAMPQNADSVFKASELQTEVSNEADAGQTGSVRRSGRKGLSMSVISENIKETKQPTPEAEPITGRFHHHRHDHHGGRLPDKCRRL